MKMALKDFVGRPLAERQREVEERLKTAADLPPEVREGITKILKHDLIAYGVVLPMAMRRELWELIWSVFRDTVEARAEEALTKLEKPKDSIFG